MNDYWIMNHWLGWVALAILLGHAVFIIWKGWSMTKKGKKGREKDDE